MASTTVITPESLTAPTPIVPSTPPQDNTNYGAIIGGISDQIGNSFNDLNTTYKTKLSEQVQTGNGISTIEDLLKNKASDTYAAQRDAGVFTETDNLNNFVTQLNDINTQAKSLNREAQAIPIQIQQESTGTGRTDRGVAPIEAARLRENALKALSLGQQSDIVSAAVTGSQIKLQAAKDKAQQAVDLKYAPLEAELAIRKEQYDRNKDTLALIDKSRTEALGQALKKEENQLETQKQREKDISGIMIEAAKNGADEALRTRISNAKNLAEAITIAGDKLRTPNNEVVKLGDNAAVLIDKNTGKILKTIGSPNPGTPSSILANIPNATPTLTSLVNASTLVQNFSSVDARKLFTQNVTRLAKAGDEKALGEYVLGTTLDNIKDPDERKRVKGGFLISQNLTRLQASLDAYQKAGGNTNIFKGTSQQIAQKLGNVGDPELARIGADINNTLDTLTRARTGAALTPSEEDFYNRILPSTKKSAELNSALISGLKTSLMGDVENSVRNQITSDGYAVLKATLPDLLEDTGAIDSYINNSLTTAGKSTSSTGTPTGTIISGWLKGLYGQ